MTPVAGSARPVVPICIVFALHDAVCIWRDHGLDTGCFQHAQHPFWCVIRFIGQERLNIGDNIGQQRVRAFESCACPGVRWKLVGVDNRSAAPA